MTQTTADPRFQAPGYRTDGEILRETAELTERLDGALLTGDRRCLAEERLQALRDEQASRRRARSSRPDVPGDWEERPGDGHDHGRIVRPS
jgi:hypothetical protein